MMQNNNEGSCLIISARKRKPYIFIVFAKKNFLSHGVMCERNLKMLIDMCTIQEKYKNITVKRIVLTFSK